MFVKGQHNSRGGIAFADTKVNGQVEVLMLDVGTTHKFRNATDKPSLVRIPDYFKKEPINTVGGWGGGWVGGWVAESLLYKNMMR